MTGHATLERLEAVLDEQRELYTMLDALSTTQGDLIEADRTDELLTLLGERSGVIERLDASNEQMRVLRAELDGGTAIGSGDRDRLRERVAAVGRIAARVAERDAADEARLSERRDAIAGKLKGADRGKAALSAYGAGAGAYAKPAGARFQDRRA
ncbi:MAG: hypothetical protein AAF297_02395 [Planctomycetota bacterium]